MDSSTSEGLVSHGVVAAPEVRKELVASGSLPSAWNSKDKWNLLSLSDENLKVSYHGPGKTDIDAAAVRTTECVPTTRCALYYFEITVVHAGQSGYIGIGLCAANVNLNRLPGWERNSFGYHGDDGHAFRDSGTGVAYGPPYTTGDVIGCCWNMIDGSVFFTKNGIALGVAFQHVRGTFYPTVGLRTQGEIVHANFGQPGAAPFYFDIESFAQEVKANLMSTILSESRLPNYYDVVTDLVLNFMIHNGFAASAEIFARDTGRLNAIRDDLALTIKRQSVCRYVLDGQIPEAIRAMSELEPAILEADSRIMFDLKCQHFVEMVRGRTVPTSNLIEFGRTELASFRDRGDYQDERLKEVFSLLAYPDPTDCPVSYLLHTKRREPVASSLNVALLTAQKRARSSILERAVSQIVIAQSEFSSKNTGSLALVSMRDFL
ncbi:Ran-binding protein 10 [Porphyridium purpureum]|uniref:Ran-binding protein 10 n=1 Tax=Porphyridium purpureum TaxID=35688 RepID=A0A5J4YXM8_PORPP|nr:Ran-binding protein 10 [Porphyridium purpureum]|eukprot:POR3148..scf209_3